MIELFQIMREILIEFKEMNRNLNNMNYYLDKISNAQDGCWPDGRIDKNMDYNQK